MLAVCESGFSGTDKVIISSTQHAARSTQHAARSTQHAARSTQHAARQHASTPVRQAPGSLPQCRSHAEFVAIARVWLVCPNESRQFPIWKIYLSFVASDCAIKRQRCINIAAFDNDPVFVGTAYDFACNNPAHLYNFSNGGR